MRVTLLHNTPLWVCARAIRTCWDSHDKSDSFLNDYQGNIDKELCNSNYRFIGEKDKELIARVGNKNKHKSVLEAITYNFEIDGISRACLIELTRHRIASYSVKSSRYTLKELKDVDFEFCITVGGIKDFNRLKLEKYFVLDNLSHLDICALCESIVRLQERLNDGISNDIIKYMLPECFKTSLVWTINARSLQNFLELRTSKSALPEIRKLALAVFEALPADHKYLFEDFVNKD